MVLAYRPPFEVGSLMILSLKSGVPGAAANNKVVIAFRWRGLPRQINNDIGGLIPNTATSSTTGM